MAERAETIFGVFSAFDWIEATKQSGLVVAAQVDAIDNIVVISSPGFQKKLLMELILTISQQEKA